MIMTDNLSKQLKETLISLICEKERRILSFRMEDVEAVIKFADDDNVKKKIIDYVTKHPNASAQEIYHLIPTD